MIDISENPRNNNVAHIWFNDLWTFLTEEHRFESEKNEGIAKSQNAPKTYMEKAIKKAKYAIERKYLREVFNKETFKGIVLCPVDELCHKAENYERECKSKGKNFNKDISEVMIFLYEIFTVHMDKTENVKEGIKIMRRLGVNTCPYCNRAYTFTVAKAGNVTRPEFDHFYNKTDYPILALSFYNLVPSCQVCNHIKGTKTIKVNPYQRGFHSKFDVKINGKGLDRNGLVLLNTDNVKVGFRDVNLDDMENVDKLGLDCLYQQHGDYIKDLLDKIYAYDQTSRELLSDAFQGTSELPSQVYDFAFGTYLGVMQEHHWPLAKLSKDVLEQFGIV